MMELYDRKSQAISVAKVGRSRKYSHFFGGRLEDYGFKVAGDCPLHLVWLLDTADPLCMLRLRRKYVPLCYGFQFGGCATAYRLNRNTIQILSPLKPSINPDFPYPRYPSHFQAKSLTLRRCPYDARNPEDALMCSAFFGLRHVSQETLALIAQRLDEFGHWDDVELLGASREDHLREYPSNMPLPQGIPDSRCIYDRCKHFGRAGSMEIVAYHPGNPMKHEQVMWGPGVEMVCLIFQMCNRCGTFYVSNQCT